MPRRRRQAGAALRAQECVLEICRGLLARLLVVLLPVAGAVRPLAEVAVPFQRSGILALVPCVLRLDGSTICGA